MSATEMPTRTEIRLLISARPIQTAAILCGLSSASGIKKGSYRWV